MKTPIAIFFVVLLTAACSKDEYNAANEGIGIKVIRNADNYNARANFYNTDNNIYVASVGNENEQGTAVYGLLKPKLHKIDGTTGNLLWQKILPGIVYNLWQAIPLNNGNILLAGLDSTRKSQRIGLVIANQQGEIIQQQSFFNQTTNSEFVDVTEGSVSCVEMPNGHIFVLTLTETSLDEYLVARLYHFDANLELIADRIYSGNWIFESSGLSLGNDGYLYFLSNFGYDGTNNIWINRIDPNTLNAEGINIPSLYEGKNTPNSNLLIAENGNMIWSGVNGISQFNLRHQEGYEISDSISIFIFNPIDQSLINKQITGFSQLGYISKIIKAPGGYLALGTSNIPPTGITELANYSALMLKLDMNLNLEWMKELNPQFTSLVGMDVVDIGTGYQLSATHYSINEFNQPILITTDYNGNLY